VDLLPVLNSWFGRIFKGVCFIKSIAVSVLGGGGAVYRSVLIFI
jgi:hypothetical protein